MVRFEILGQTFIHLHLSIPQVLFTATLQDCVFCFVFVLFFFQKKNAHAKKYYKLVTRNFLLYTQNIQGFFSKFLMGGTQNFWSPSVPDGDKAGWGGVELAKKNLTEAKTPHLIQN